MKKLKSLALAFTLAATGIMGVSTANAQTVPANPRVVLQEPQYTQSHFNNTLTKEGVDNVAYTFGAERVYRNVGAGYTDRVSPLTGERIGLEFSVYNGQATVRAAYNMKDPAQYNQFMINKGNDASMDTQMALNSIATFGIYPTYPVYPVYGVPHHHNRGYVAPIILPPIIIGGGHHNDHRGNDHRGNDHRGNDHRGNDHRGGDHRGGDHNRGGDRGYRGPGR